MKENNLVKVECRYCNFSFEITKKELEEQDFYFGSNDCKELFYGGGYNDRKELDYWNNYDKN